MPVDPHALGSVPAASRRLNGWKEIAAHLGKGVRTVQRWEKEFGLPVRRLGRSGSEIVFAFAEELDAWQRPVEGMVASNPDATWTDSEPGRAGLVMGSGPDIPEDIEGPGPGTGPGQNVDPPKAFRVTWLGRRWRIVGLFGVVAVSAAIAWWALAPARSTGPAGQGISSDGAPGSRGSQAAGPAKVRVDLDTLIVSDAAGHELWRHRFPLVLASPAYAAGAGSAHRHVIVSDIDGDGVREVLFVVQSDDDHVNHRLYCFNHDGTLRWVAFHDSPIRFGGTEYGGPFGAVGVYLTQPANATPSIWLVSASPLFPCVLERLDPRTGRPTSAYWSNGHITTVTASVVGLRPVILVGGSNNETKGAALVALDPGNPNGSTPAVSAHYRCTSCPAGGPLAFVVFPKPRRFAETAVNQSIFSILTAPGGVNLVVTEAFAGEAPNQAQADALYALDSSLAPLSFDVSDDYASVSAWVARRRGDPVPAADPRAEHEYILSWKDGRFVKLPIPGADVPR